MNAALRHDEPRSSVGIVDAFIRGAHLTSEEPRAPVYICLDAGLQEESVEAAPFIPDSHRFKPAPPPCAAEADVRVVVEKITKAERPLFLFGRGSRRQEDWQQRIELAELSGASVVTSVLERAVFPTDHGLHLGPPLDRLSSRLRQALTDADLIVSFEWVDLNGLLQQVIANPAELGASLVAVSLDNALHNGWSMDHFALAPADIRIAAGADAFTGQLLSVLRSALKGRPRWDGSSRNERVQRTYSPKSKEEIAPADIEIALAEIRGDQRFTMAHVGFAWSGDAYRYRDPLDFLGHDGGAGLAAGPGLTVGAALALKDSGRPVISVMGDGDFLQGASALWTAAHYRIPALFIVSNNRSNFNDEIHQNTIAKARNRPQQNRWIGQSMTDPDIDLAAIARAQGVQGVGPVKNVPDLLTAIREGLEAVAAGQPYFIDAWVGPTEMAEVAPRGRVKGATR